MKYEGYRHPKRLQGLAITPRLLTRLLTAIRSPNAAIAKLGYRGSVARGGGAGEWNSNITVKRFSATEPGGG